MRLRNIVVLGVVEAAATLLLNEGLRLAKESGLFEKAKERWDEWTGSLSFIPGKY